MGLGRAVGVGIEVGVKVGLGMRGEAKDGAGESVLIMTSGGSKEGADGNPARGTPSWQPMRKTINIKSRSGK